MDEWKEFYYKINPGKRIFQEFPYAFQSNEIYLYPATATSQTDKEISLFHLDTSPEAPQPPGFFLTLRSFDFHFNS